MQRTAIRVTSMVTFVDREHPTGSVHAGFMPPSVHAASSWMSRGGIDWAKHTPSVATLFRGTDNANAGELRICDVSRGGRGLIRKSVEIRCWWPAQVLRHPIRRSKAHQVHSAADLLDASRFAAWLRSAIPVRFKARTSVLSWKNWVINYGRSKDADDGHYQKHCTCSARAFGIMLESALQ